MIRNHINIKTLGELKKSGYKTQSIKDELRNNLIRLLNQKENPFPGIIGFDDSVIPDIQRAILSRHNIILLGLRGQAKTRLARLMVNLLDEYIPVVKGSELNDDPFSPLSRFAKDLVSEKGDETPVEWVHQSERYTEKLATPDVSIADLIGDVDPIKAAALKLPYTDERVIHFGLIPRSHRCIFVINELPDLQARIQVALFNILQEEDVQIRGFKLRLPLDIHFVFTANPEDYTNRGAIVTPLKDRIDSQILTHYPKSLDISKLITRQEAKLTPEQVKKIHIPELVENLVEQIAFEARQSEYVDSNSGVSARLTISAYENLMSTAERRIILNGQNDTCLRISDIYGVIPSITGKVELVYEGEQEGPSKIAHILISKAIRNQFIHFFPNPEKLKKTEETNPYQETTTWFSQGNEVDLLMNTSDAEHRKAIFSIPGLEKLVDRYHPEMSPDKKLLLMEFALHGLAEFSFLSKHRLDTGIQFKDMLSSMLSEKELDDEDDIYTGTF
ncbi:MAG: magnesium chelatase [Calditrichaceae bacterium]